MTTVADTDLITTGEAARELGIDPSTLARWAAAGYVTPASRTIGGHMRWRITDLREQARAAREQDKD